MPMPTEIFLMTYRPLLTILFPTIGAFLILLSYKHQNIRETWTIVASVLCFASVISMLPAVLSNVSINCNLFRIFQGVNFGYRVDAFGLIFAITSSFLWIIVSFYSIGYMRALEEHAQTRYYFCFAWAMFGAIGTALAGNLLTFYIHYEILTISTYPLVAHEESEEALFAGRKYLVYLFTSGGFLLAASLITYWLTGTTDFKPNGILTFGSASRFALQILFLCFLLGFMKAAYMPFHSWLSTAMIAPTPVSALLHAVAVVNAGVFGIIRTVSYIFGVDLMHALGLGIFLACFASFTVILANLFAIGENDLKRRLAYSTINQLSLIILGVALLSPMAIKGAMMHIAFHGFMKITLFMCAGAIMVITGKTKVSELVGIGRVMPVTLTSFAMAALGMCGLPPIAGFISKWFICIGSIQSAQLLAQPMAIVFLFIVLIASLLDVVYLFPIIRTAFFEKQKSELKLELEGVEKKGGEKENKNRRKETERTLYLFMIVPLLITAAFSIIFCLFPNTFHIFDLAQMAVRDIFGGV